MHKKNILVIVPSILVLTVLGLICFYDNTTTFYYSSIEEAINNGMKIENITQDNIIEQIVNNDNFIVIFKKDNSIGVAMIEKKNNGYRWIRNKPLFSFDGSGHYSRIDFDLDINDSTVKMLIGKVHNPKICTISIQKSSEIMEIWNVKYNSSPFFYYINDNSKERPILLLSFD